jgi:LmbE family N-acetylglucosaminyl deacetylase
VSAPRRALFLFAHQDDEYGVAPWLVEEVAAGSRVACLYLTSGGFRTPAGVRDAESRAALRSLGVGDEAVAFPAGERGRVADRDLPARSLEALAMVERRLEETRFVPDRIYAPSYEGGHPDHDAAHVVAAAVAARRGILDEAWHFSLYNAYRCPRPLFSVLRQLPTASLSRRAALPFAMRWRLTLLCRRYPSQWRTWAALFPGALLERTILRREFVARFDTARLAARPHEGELLYERLFATTYGEFAERVAALRRLIPT